MTRFLVVAWRRSNLQGAGDAADYADVERQFDTLINAQKACAELVDKNRDVNTEKWGVYELREGYELLPRKARKIPIEKSGVCEGGLHDICRMVACACSCHHTDEEVEMVCACSCHHTDEEVET